MSEEQVVDRFLMVFLANLEEEANILSGHQKSFTNPALSRVVDLAKRLREFRDEYFKPSHKE